MVLCLLIAAMCFCLGLPILTAWKAALFFLFLLFTWLLPKQKFSSSTTRTLFVLLLLGGTIRVAVPKVAIEEGHQLFLTFLHEKEPLQELLPPAVFSFLQKEFVKQYPQEYWCKQQLEKNTRCWTHWNQLPTNTHSFSTDSLWEPHRYSRIVETIDFKDIPTFRPGFVNEHITEDPHIINTIYYDWINHPKDIQRPTMPFYVFYEIPKAIVGSNLCFKGSVLLQTDKDHHVDLSSSTTVCHQILPEWVNKKVYGIAISRSVPLEMHLSLNWSSALLQYLRNFSIFIFAFAAIWLSGLALPVFQSKKRKILLLLTLAIPFILFYFTPFKEFFLYPALPGAGDGNTYEGFSRHLLRALINGNWYDFFRGGQSVFYNKPGHYFLETFEHFLFGDTLIAQGLITLAFPFVLYALLLELTSPLIALISVALFSFFPHLPYLSDVHWKLLHLRRSAVLNDSETVGFLFFLGALLSFFQIDKSKYTNKKEQFAKGLFTGILLFGAIFVRPPLILAAMVLLATSAILFKRDKFAFSTLTGMALGCAFIVLLPIHNWYYGGRFVLTSDVQVNMARDLQSYFADLSHWAGVPWRTALFLFCLMNSFWNPLSNWKTRLLSQLSVSILLPLTFFQYQERLAMLGWMMTILTLLSFLSDLLKMRFIQKEAGRFSHEL